MKKTAALVVVLTCLLANNAFCQKRQAKRLEQAINAAIGRAYPACVRMWGFDTVSNQQTSGQFSGVVVTEQGHILTAAHVAVPGKTYKVMFPDGKECIAIGLGKIEFAQDKTMPDVAMMEIITKGTWPFALMGSSATLKEKDPCISIAYPESLYQPKPTIRFGLIAKTNTPRGFMQSTCIMEPGDSGGPLFDCAGRVIGLHSAIEIPENLNYEIPVDLYRKYWTALNIPKVYAALPESMDHPDVHAIHSKPRKFDGTPDLSLAFKNIGKADGKINNSCLSIISNINGKEQNAEGTLFAGKGRLMKNLNAGCFIVSKSSLIGSEPVIIKNKIRINAKVIARDKENDLVLLLPSMTLSGGIEIEKISRDSFDYKPGKFLLSPQPDSNFIVSISGSYLFSLPKITSRGFLGAAIANNKTPVLITQVKPNSPADNNGIEAGDEVLKINDTDMLNADDYGATLQKCWPGDTITINLRQKGFASKKRVVLEGMPQRMINHPAELFTSGKSLRRDGFEKITTHDAILKPGECGGPAIDLYGNLLGINIARYSRAISLITPVMTILRFVDLNMHPLK